MLNILIHVLLSPLYLILFTIKHEGAHALVCLIKGQKITSFKFIPFKDEQGRWLLGRVTFEGRQTFHGALAPYYVDALFLLIGAILWATGLIQLGTGHWFLFSFVTFFVSSVVDIVRALWKWKNGWGDFKDAKDAYNDGR